MKKINENQKVTLTVGQLKRLIKESDEVTIPDSEWKKVFGYIDQGSDFKKVGAACRRNPDKLRSRYLILKALGLNRAADDFLDGSGHYDTEFKDLTVPEVPAKYADKVADKEQFTKDYSKQKEKFAKRSMAGPLKELAQMGIEFFTLYSDGSGRNQQKAMDVLGFIPKWNPNSTGLEFRNGRRWDIAKSVIMVNGETTTGDKWFEFVDHTNEGVDSPSYGYDVGFAGDRRVGSAEAGSNEIREWIRDNVKATGTDDSITSSGKFVVNTPYNGISFTIDHDGFSLSKNLTDAEDSSIEKSARDIIFPKVKEIIKETFGVDNIGVLSGVVLNVAIHKCMIDINTGDFKTFDGNEGEIIVGDRIGYDPNVTSLQMQAIKENNYYFNIDTIKKELSKASSEMRSKFIDPLPGKFINTADAYKKYEFNYNGAMSIFDKVKAWNDGSRRPNLKAMTDDKVAAYWYVCSSRGFDAEKEILTKELERRGLRPNRARLTGSSSASESTKNTIKLSQLKRLIVEHQDTLIIHESAEDEWLDGWLKDHPEDLENTLAWINKIKPEMNDAGKNAWARNILKKRHREGKIDPEHPTPVEDKPTQSSTMNVKREATPEDEAKFCAEITNYEKDTKGKLWAPNKRFLIRADLNSKTRNASKFFKPVGFTDDGKVKLDVFDTTNDYEEFKDSDYDDGRIHAWADAKDTYLVNTDRKIGEELGELKDGQVVLLTGREKGKILIGWGPNIIYTWRLYNKWYASNRSRYRGW